MNNGIISNERVKQFGEVFTPDSIVCDMLDLVEKQWGDISDEEYILKTYLEPACGDGQFLIRLLSRKLERVAKLPVEERELALIKAVSSIYGVDIQDDNVKSSKKRMLRLIKGESVKSFDLVGSNEIKVDFGIKVSRKIIDIINSILSVNIISKDTLDVSDTILLYEYIFTGSRVQVKRFELKQPNVTYNESKVVEYNELDRILITTSDKNDNLEESYEF